ncbi:hypothetical protein CAOG_01000 [Capsaspora owczarzaki ATCC 30864]|uniref:Uncharacterized protein n=1 Tax=Capsaspora owczarzaki (strain ATCC 30864) TaxID=595528 RepID=A0A0D2WJK6_CAPO3|nr:hypothetical protein CAOG_01000 [Capsaspora owczarzaki ATCC 30864]KJE89553.1 hypothetical protein, variant [Capsaspora owczarzaki ATCC 30864]|eukprot:XP_004365871.1 hypothetical protein CAOG_01000 [Capsaspora owczarzaki ATCC 30864]
MSAGSVNAVIVAAAAVSAAVWYFIRGSATGGIAAAGERTTSSQQHQQQQQQQQQYASTASPQLTQSQQQQQQHDGGAHNNDAAYGDAEADIHSELRGFQGRGRNPASEEHNLRNFYAFMAAGRHESPSPRPSRPTSMIGNSGYNQSPEPSRFAETRGEDYEEDDLDSRSRPTRISLPTVPDYISGS